MVQHPKGLYFFLFLLSHEKETSDTYTVAENTHTHFATNSSEGEIAPHDNQWYGPFNITFVATCTSPQMTMNAGDTIVLHATIMESGGETGHYIRESASLNFDAEGVGMGGIRYRNQGIPTNLKGSTEVGSRYGEAKSGEWDYVMRVPSGHTNELRAINFDACGCRTHWVYKWCTIFELEEMDENNNENQTSDPEE